MPGLRPCGHVPQLFCFFDLPHHTVIAPLPRVQPPDATWGNILSDGKGYIFDAPWLTFTPGFTILFVVLAFNLCGEGLREAYNPKLRQQR